LERRTGARDRKPKRSKDDVRRAELGRKSEAEQVKAAISSQRKKSRLKLQKKKGVPKGGKKSSYVVPRRPETRPFSRRVVREIKEANEGVRTSAEYEAILEKKGFKLVKPQINDDFWVTWDDKIRFATSGGRGVRLIAHQNLPAFSMIPVIGLLAMANDSKGTEEKATHLYQLQGGGAEGLQIIGTMQNNTFGNAAMCANEPSTGEEDGWNALMRHDNLLLTRDVLAGQEILSWYGMTEYWIRHGYTVDEREMEYRIEKWGGASKPGSGSIWQNVTEPTSWAGSGP
jgi:hypothetical protein